MQVSSGQQSLGGDTHPSEGAESGSSLRFSENASVFLCIFRKKVEKKKAEGPERQVKEKNDNTTLNLLK